MPDRLIAISDIHGYREALDGLLAAIDPRPDDTIVPLGDFVDRGPDSRGVIDRLLQLERQCRMVPILGNHDEMMLLICEGYRELLADWLEFGGDATMASYDNRIPEAVPPEHIAFLRRCHLLLETEHHFFTHASYDPEVPLDCQSGELLRWQSLREQTPGPHRSGKTAIVAHTAQKDAEILDLGYLKCIDTWIYGDGWLTALEVHTGQVWQVDQRGQFRGPS